MATLAQNKKFVYLYWKEPKEGYKDNDSYGDDVWLLDLGDKHFSNIDNHILWADAAEYIRLRLSMIEEFEEQLDWLMHYTENSVETKEQDCARKHLIENTKSRIKNMKKGMTDNGK